MAWLLQEAFHLATCPRCSLAPCIHITLETCPISLDHRIVHISPLGSFMQDLCLNINVLISCPQYSSWNGA
jgi:hypothetical protein